MTIEAGELREDGYAAATIWMRSSGNIHCKLGKVTNLQWLIYECGRIERGGKRECDIGHHPKRPGFVALFERKAG